MRRQQSRLPSLSQIYGTRQGIDWLDIENVRPFRPPLADTIDPYPRQVGLHELFRWLVRIAYIVERPPSLILRLCLVNTASVPGEAGAQPNHLEASCPPARPHLQFCRRIIIARGGCKRSRNKGMAQPGSKRLDRLQNRHVSLLLLS